MESQMESETTIVQTTKTAAANPHFVTIDAGGIIYASHFWDSSSCDGPAAALRRRRQAAGRRPESDGVPLSRGEPVTPASARTPRRRPTRPDPSMADGVQRPHSGAAHAGAPRAGAQPAAHAGGRPQTSMGFAAEMRERPHSSVASADEADQRPHTSMAMDRELRQLEQQPPRPHASLSTAAPGGERSSSKSSGSSFACNQATILDPHAWAADMLELSGWTPPTAATRAAASAPARNKAVTSPWSHSLPSCGAAQSAGNRLTWADVSGTRPARARSSTRRQGAGASPEGARPHASWTLGYIQLSGVASGVAHKPVVVREERKLGKRLTAVFDDAPVGNDRRDAIPAAQSRGSPIGVQSSGHNGVQRRGSRTPDRPGNSVYTSSKHAPASTSRMDKRRGDVKNDVHDKLKRSAALTAMFRQQPKVMRRLMKDGKGDPNGEVGLGDMTRKDLDRLTKRSGTQEEDFVAVFRVFKYFDFTGSSTLRLEDARFVLAELGVRAGSAKEHACIEQLVEQHETAQARLVSFSEFVYLLLIVRAELNSMRWTLYLRLFDGAGGSTSGRLNRIQVNSVLAQHLGLSPQSEREELEIDSIFHELTRQDGALSFQEFQEFIDRVSMTISMRRSEDALVIAQGANLEPHLIAEFRYDLKKLWKIFQRYSRTQEGFPAKIVSGRDLRPLLLDCGVLSWSLALQPFVLDLLPSGPCPFRSIVITIHKIRIEISRYQKDDIMEKFIHYSRNNRQGTLQKKDIYCMLDDFDMTPKTREDQQRIASIVERFDGDGSGHFDFQEFLHFYIRLTEYHLATKAEEEYHAMRELKFGQRQVLRLRRRFLGLCPGFGGLVSHQTLATVFNSLQVEFLGREGQAPKLMGILRTAPNKKVNFLDFASLVRLGLDNSKELLEAEIRKEFAEKAKKMIPVEAKKFLEQKIEWPDERETDSGSDDEAPAVGRAPAQPVAATLSGIASGMPKSPLPPGRAPDDAEKRLDSQFQRWLWQEVMQLRKPVSHSKLTDLTSPEAKGLQESCLDEKAWERLSRLAYDTLGPTIGDVKLHRVLKQATFKEAAMIVQMPAPDSVRDMRDVRELQHTHHIQVLGVEMASKRGMVDVDLPDDTQVTHMDRLWVAFEGGGVSSDLVERLLESKWTEVLQHSLLPLFKSQTPQDFQGKRLVDCRFEETFGAAICGAEDDHGVHLFPRGVYRISSSTTSLFFYLISPVKFLVQMASLSNDLARSLNQRISMRRTLPLTIAPTEMPQAPLIEEHRLEPLEDSEDEGDESEHELLGAGDLELQVCPAPSYAHLERGSVDRVL